MDVSMEKENAPPETVTPNDTIVSQYSMAASNTDEQFFTPAARSPGVRTSMSTFVLTSEESLRDVEDIDKTVKQLGVNIDRDMENIKNIPWKSPQKKPSNLPNFPETRHSISALVNLDQIEEKEGSRRSLPVTTSQSDFSIADRKRSISPAKPSASLSAPNVAKVLGAKLQAEVQYAASTADLNDQLQENSNSSYRALEDDLNSIYLTDCSLPEYQLEPQLRHFEQKQPSDGTPKSSRCRGSSSMTSVPQATNSRRLSENPRLSTKLADSKQRRTAVNRYKKMVLDWYKLGSQQYQIVNAFLRAFPEDKKPRGYMEQLQLSADKKIKKAERLFNDTSISTSDLKLLLEAKEHQLRTKMRFTACQVTVLCDWQKTYQIPQAKKPSEARKLHTIDESALENAPLSSDGASPIKPQPSEGTIIYRDLNTTANESIALDESQHSTPEKYTNGAAADLNISDLVMQLGRTSLEEKLDTTQLSESLESTQEEEVTEAPAVKTDAVSTGVKHNLEAVVKTETRTDYVSQFETVELEETQRESFPTRQLVPLMDFSFLDPDTSINASFINAPLSVDVEADVSLSRNSLSKRQSPRFAKEDVSLGGNRPSRRSNEFRTTDKPVVDDLLDTSSRRNSLDRFNEPFPSPRPVSPAPVVVPIVSPRVTPQVSPPMTLPQAAGETTSQEPKDIICKQLNLDFTMSLNETEDDLMNFTLPDFLKQQDNQLRLRRLLESGEWRNLILSECCAFVWRQKETNGGFDAVDLPSEFFSHELRTESLVDPLDKDLVNLERSAMLQSILTIASDLWPLDSSSRNSLHVPDMGNYAASKYSQEKHPSKLTVVDFEAICSRHLLQESTGSSIEMTSRNYPWRDDVGRKFAHEMVNDEHYTYLRKEVRILEAAWDEEKSLEEVEDFGRLPDAIMADALDDVLTSARHSLARSSTGRLSMDL